MDGLTLIHFRREEWVKDPDRVHPDLALALDAARETAGVPIVIHGAYDDSGHATHSYHYSGQAVDFHFAPGLTRRREFEVLESQPLLGGFGFYPEWRPRPGWHVDLRPSPRRYWLRQGNRYHYCEDRQAFLTAIAGEAANRDEPASAKLSPDLASLVAEAAGTAGLPADIVTGVVLVESGGNPEAIRYEPAFDRKNGLASDDFVPAGCSRATEEVGRAMSWGLMQLLGEAARCLGFRDWFPALCRPALGLAWGCRCLVRLHDRYGAEGWEVVLRAYNAGPGGRHDAGNDYPARVLAAGGRP